MTHNRVGESMWAISQRTGKGRAGVERNISIQIPTQQRSSLGK